MTFNHGVRSSILRWVTTPLRTNNVCGGFLFIGHLIVNQKCQSRISVYNAVAVFNVSGRSIKSVRFNVFL